MTSSSIFFKHHIDFLDRKIALPASKSISNRALIINALSNSNATLKNLSKARDTQTMIELVNSTGQLLDVKDAGTTMRFLTAYLAVTNQHKTLTGSSRMQERPIKILVEALQKLGADITYLNNEGFPPIRIQAFTDQQIKDISIKGDVSSQYISAIMMIAPLLINGLEIKLTGKVGSKPYIKMTASVMASFGVNVDFDGKDIDIRSQQYQGTDYLIEPDWSAASYWYAMVALSKSSSITLSDLQLVSIQGDSIIVDIMKKLGVATNFTKDGAILSKTGFESHFEHDFTDCPDLAQTVAVICAAKGITAKLSGLESLRIKETDRIYALQQELSKMGASLNPSLNDWILEPSTNLPTSVVISTYDDHRMAMAFAPIAMLMDVTITNPDVVNKSYPHFWDDLELVGISSVRS